jgi:hypothetical protein
MSELEGLAGPPAATRRPAIPFGRIADLRMAAWRLAVLRALFAAGSVALLLLALSVARRDATPSVVAPSRAGSIIVLDASASVQRVAYPQIAATLDDLSRSSKPMGLVIFSDVAYEALPPTTPASELARFLPLFQLHQGHYPANPWTLNFTRGTRISDGIKLAQEIIAKQERPGAGIVLVSDLATAASDLDELTRILVELRRTHTPIVIAPVRAAPSDRSYFERLLGRSAFREPRAGTVATTTSRPTLTHSPAFPWSLVIVGGGLLLVLALGERLLARLTWRAAAGLEARGR